MLHTIVLWIAYFFFYCFLGWIWESTYDSIKDRKFVNRGFLHGPIIPIYGSGAIVVLLFTIPAGNNLVMIFVFGMIGASILEFVVGYTMESIFKVKYWDYSECFLNIRGYICLKATVLWGFFSVFFIGYAHKHVAVFFEKLSVDTLISLEYLILIIFIADTILSVQEALDLRKLILSRMEAHEEIQRMMQEMQRMKKRMDVMVAVVGDDMTSDLEAMRKEIALKRENLEHLGQDMFEHANSVIRRNPGIKMGRSFKEHAHMNLLQMRSILEEKVDSIKNI